MTHNTDKAELIAQYAQMQLDAAYVRRVAHDVRNQINTILMATELLGLQQSSAGEAEGKYTTSIRHASEDILTILEAAVEALNEKRSTKDI